MARVERNKRLKNGDRAYQDQCEGLLVSTSPCAGEIKRHAKEATSFGEPFTARSMLCAAHAKQLGFK